MPFDLTSLYIEGNKIHADGIDADGVEHQKILTILVHGLESDDGLCGITCSQEYLRDVVAMISASFPDRG